MAMFSTSGSEKYNALYSALEQPADVTALEREQAPGFLDGDLGGAAIQGAETALKRFQVSALAGGQASHPLAAGNIQAEIDAGVYGERTRQMFADAEKNREAKRQEIAREIIALRPDPKTNGMASQILHGLTDVLGTAMISAPLGSRGGPVATGAVYGYSQTQVGKAEGLDPLTAMGKGTIEGVSTGIGVALPAAVRGGLAMRMASGAAMNVALGIPTRASVSTLLRASGYEEMARQYEPLDTTSILTELVLGAAFGGVMGKRPAKAVEPSPDNVQPVVLDAALTANLQTHAEIHTAPGVPVNTHSRQAHVTALNQAVESLMMGREVNVENLLKNAGFVGKRPDFDALKIIAEELDKAGAADLVAQVRAIEADARSRGLVVDDDSLGSVVLSDMPVESTVTGAALAESRVKVGEEYIPTQLILVEAADVQATMAKAENQFRDRTRTASDMQIASMAANLDPALLMDAPVMDYGSPVLAADGTVIGGNGRAAAVLRAYEKGKADAYRMALREQFGDAAEGMQAPMLVRVLKRDVDIARAAILSNEGGGLRMSALEQAKVDGERLGDFSDVQLAEDGSVNINANMNFVRRWAAEMPANQRAAIMDADGRLSAEGAGRLRNAILYRAYGDSPTLARLVEATDPGSRNLAAALTRASAAVADARDAIARGDMYPMALHDDIISAVEKLEQLRSDGMSVDFWTKQLDAFGGGMSAEARLLVGFFDSNLRSSKALSDGIIGFYKRLMQAGNPKQGSMFEASQPDKMRILTLALEQDVGGDAPMYARGGVVEKQKMMPFLRSWFWGREGKPADVYDTPSDTVIRQLQKYAPKDGVLHLYRAKVKGSEDGDLESWTPDRDLAEWLVDDSDGGRMLVSRTVFASDVLFDSRLFNKHMKSPHGADVSWDEVVVANGEMAAHIRAVRGANGSRSKQTKTPEFKAWFGDSKVVGANGEPLVVYHGTQADFSEFKPSELGALGPGIYLTTNPKEAANYTVGYTNGGENIMPVYASVKNPLYVKDGESVFEILDASDDTIADALMRAGYDGIIFDRVESAWSKKIAMASGMETTGDSRHIVVFNPTQIKSAIGNRGTFDPANPDITFSRGKARTQETTETLTTALRSMFGKDADRLLDAGRLRIVQSVSDLPGSGHPADVGGMYWRGESWLVADNTGLSQIRGRVLHEIGEHAGMRDMLGDDLYADTLARIEAKVQAGDEVFAKARTLAEGRANKPEHVPAETLAYLVENAPELTLVRRVLAAVRQWLYRVTGGRFVDLSQADLQMMAVASLRRYAREAEVAAKGEDVPWYMTLFHGSPSVFRPEADAPLGALKWKYINTGEGAQIFGYGHYLAQREWIARKHYRDRLSRNRKATLTIERPGKAPLTIDEQDEPAYQINDRIVHLRMDGTDGALADAIYLIKQRGYNEALADLQRAVAGYEKMVNSNPTAQLLADLERIRASLSALEDVTVESDGTRVLRSDIKELRPEPSIGGLYGKHIPDDEWANLMIWDAPIGKQPHKVQAAFASLGLDVPQMRAADAYRMLARMIDRGEDDSIADEVADAYNEVLIRRDAGDLSDEYEDLMFGGEELASVILYHLGVAGHRFLDGESRDVHAWDDPDAQFNVVLFSDDFGRMSWNAKGELGKVPDEWTTANGRGRLVREGGDYFNAFLDGKQISTEPMLVHDATRLVEKELEGGLYSRVGDGDTMQTNMLDDTTMPNARALSEQADAEFSAAVDFSPAFMVAAQCALRFGQ